MGTDGSELFYSEAGTLIAVSVRTKPEFEVGPATRLFSHAAFTVWQELNYDVSADGQTDPLAREAWAASG